MREAISQFDEADRRAIYNHLVAMRHAHRGFGVKPSFVKNSIAELGRSLGIGHIPSAQSSPVQPSIHAFPIEIPSTTPDFQPRRNSTISSSAPVQDALPEWAKPSWSERMTTADDFGATASSPEAYDLPFEMPLTDAAPSLFAPK